MSRSQPGFRVELDGVLARGCLDNGTVVLEGGTRLADATATFLARLRGRGRG